ncbi:hypothetical protein GMA8713_01711 [Grimontia marina]|uniref:Uncharacterized protein n=1 Tax=Grimontia marina TaxID=646534 RepID=A0A128F2U5_9GAMM|nr:hypothetical protein GMA8713_01711 [Grimontia marina]
MRSFVVIQPINLERFLSFQEVSHILYTYEMLISSLFVLVIALL